MEDDDYYYFISWLICAISIVPWDGQATCPGCVPAYIHDAGIGSSVSHDHIQDTQKKKWKDNFLFLNLHLVSKTMKS